MEFVGFQCRKEGRLLPRHVLWAARVQGHLFIGEEYDPELSRHVKVATLKSDPGRKVVLGPLLDVVVVSCSPQWWTLTGWERVDTPTLTAPQAFQQSWIL